MQDVSLQILVNALICERNNIHNKNSDLLRINTVKYLLITGVQ